MDEVETLVDGFHRAAIARQCWDHRSHLAAAAWTALRCGDEDPLAAIRAAILRYNTGQGIVTTETSGYHETVTAFWMGRVVALLAARPAGDSELAFVNRVLAELGDGAQIFRHWSRERLFSPEARRTWVPPDVKGLQDMS